MADTQDRFPSAALRRRERRARLSAAFFRWESAATIATTIVLAILLPDPFRGLVPIWNPWTWVLLGAISEGMILITALRDPEAQAQATCTLISERFPLERLRDVDIRQHVADALDHRKRIESLVVRIRSKTLRDGLRELADRITDWIAVLYQLAVRIDASLLYTGANAQTVITDENVSEQPDVDLSATVEAIGSVYVQMQLIAARGFESTRLRALRALVEEQTRTLDQRLQALGPQGASRP